MIKTIQSEFALTDEQVQLSWNTLAKIGNISSGTVIYMLNELMQQQIPHESYGLMIGMGPGFAQEAVLLKW
ncbi:3-oxoacyl-[acyl-carrier-protein] synthase III C-terminal domain-containing protein [Leptolyngbya sp. 7M]|uniref:3-oxoacyl-[acyl-carrier-protein] synthase III C-terminal domain-containing protein n=1 Tax=Leptolyngbya sp. 7M TaxID=2812896 RepID=UPI001B8B2166|nr:3-oxoacyl-[acyl-carrier-protein] synthase III C-terminal domain-containing protein [Leptolyngbya sp. 7M]QYO67394.1 hypothetical protein JVX88_11705 [Leptolyngbya sp. 7M]